MSGMFVLVRCGLLPMNGTEIEVAPSTVGEVLNKYGIAPAPDRHHPTWPDHLNAHRHDRLGDTPHEYRHTT